MLFRSPSFERQRAYYTPEEYMDLLKDAGFQIESFKIFESAAYYQNRETLIAWISPLVNFASHLSEDLRKEFIEDMVDEKLLIDPPAPDGSINARFQMFRIVAKK